MGKNLKEKRTIWNTAAQKYPQLFEIEEKDEEEVRHAAINRLSNFVLLQAWSRLLAKSDFIDKNKHLTYQQTKQLRPMYNKAMPDECWPTFDTGVPVFSPYASTKQTANQTTRRSKWATKRRVGRQSERSQISIKGEKFDVCALAWRCVTPSLHWTLSHRSNLTGNVEWRTKGRRCRSKETFLIRCTSSQEEDSPNEISPTRLSKVACSIEAGSYDFGTAADRYIY